MQTPADADTLDHWTLRTDSGQTLCVPPAMSSMTSYVLLEQEHWFEPEMSLLPRLLLPGMQALDIGANHGLVTLEIARCIGPGRVWAFEPTSAPRRRLARSVVLNGLSDRVVVVDAGLSDRPGQASFAIHENSELNSSGGAGERRETVRLETLDAFLATHAQGVNIDFIKLDAEGDETRVLAGGARFFAEQSPVVLFELKHGDVVNTGLLDAWQALGFGLFRWSAELGLLRPYLGADEEAAFALNLVAVRPAQQTRLASRGLLTTERSLREVRLPVPSAQALDDWCAQPSQRGLGVPAAGPRTGADAVLSQVYGDSLRAVASAHLQADLAPADRLALLVQAGENMLAAQASAAGFMPEAWALVVHCWHAIGQPLAAVRLASQLLAQWPPQIEVQRAFVPPLRADLARQRSSDASSWLRQMLAEFVATKSSFSSYFGAPTPERWAALLDHPDHSAEIERRYLLSHMIEDRAAPLDRLRLLPAAAHTCNPAMWQALMQAARAIRAEALQAA